MRKLIILFAALALAPAALAAGGASGSGQNSNSPTAGGATGGGGGGGGGSKPAAACDPVVSFTSSSGYVPYGAGTAAVWVDYTLKGCGGGSQYTTTLTEADVAGVAPTYSVVLAPQVSGRSVAYAFDNEPLPNDTTYQVTFTVTDSDGNVVDSRSSLETTPKARVS